MGSFAVFFADSGFPLVWISSAVALSRPTLPLDGNTGGLPEYIIPNGIGSGAINVTGVGGVNPLF